MKLQFIAGIAVIAAFCNASASSFYVATDGNDANDGLSSQTAFLTLAKAVEVATNSTEAAEILIAPGEYPQTAAIRVESPLTIRGTGAAATNVVLKNTAPSPRTNGSTWASHSCRILQRMEQVRSRTNAKSIGTAFKRLRSERRESPI